MIPNRDWSRQVLPRQHDQKQQVRSGLPNADGAAYSASVRLRTDVRHRQPQASVQLSASPLQGPSGSAVPERLGRQLVR